MSYVKSSHIWIFLNEHFNNQIVNGFEPIINKERTKVS